MIPENIQKWIEALRSGEYNQATGSLRGPTGYCCLGVGCDISRVGSWGEETNDYSGTIHYITNGKYFYDSSLPDAVRDWFGLNDNIGTNPMFDDRRAEYGESYNLTVINDIERASFDEIADYIEENWKDIVTKEVREKYDTP